MLWIIDGYNFIRGARRFADLEARQPAEGRRQALEWLGRFAQVTGEQVWVVMDAYSGLHAEMLAAERGGIRILSSRGAYTADEEIAELAKQHGAAALVVSSDKAVQRAAVKAGALIIASDEFEREVAKILERDLEAEAGAEAGRQAGNAFQPPKEKKKAMARLRKYQ